MTMGLRLMLIGFRLAHTQVRNIELRLAKARKVLLSVQEEEISFELANGFQELKNRVNAEDKLFNRRRK
ncbi:MAG: hypothetical protein U0903_15625 [Planctomycetales bacterium]